MDNFHQGENYTGQIASHQAELKTERNFIDQKYLSIKSLQTDYLNLDSSSSSGINNERSNTFIKMYFFVEVLTILQKNVF